MVQAVRQQLFPFATSLSTQHWIQDSKLRKCYLAAYPYLHMTWEGTVTAFILLYCIGKTDFHSPFTFLSKSRLKFAETIPERETGDSPKNLLQVFENRFVTSFATALTTGLQFGAFFLQFLDWWLAAFISFFFVVLACHSPVLDGFD